jgi:xylulokinase
MLASPGTVLAIDLGTSTAKALIVGPNGDVLGGGQDAYPTVRNRDDRDEQHVEDWLEAIVQAIATARRFAPTATIEAIAVTGQMHGTVLYDSNALPLHPAVIWSDRRGAASLPSLLASLGPSLASTIGGPLATGYLAATLSWFRQERPQIWQHIHRVALPTDAIVHALCGEFATDPSNAAGTGLLNGQTGDWDSGILEILGYPREWLPRIVPSGSTVGNLTARAADLFGLPEGTPVITAGGDAPAAAAGSGVLTDDIAMVVVSTGAQFMRPTGTWSPEPGGRWHTWPAALPEAVPGDRWLRVGAMLNGGRAIDWIHRTVAPDLTVSDLVDSTRNVTAGVDGLIFLPYLAGERTPILDPYARGAFIGLTDRHEPRHLVRAVLEGICLSIADTAKQMAAGLSAPTSIVLGGGGASVTFRGILASVLGVPLVVPQVQSTSAHGAASVAAMANGWRTASDIVEFTRRGATVVHPVAADHARYGDLLASYRAATDALLPLMHRMQDVP